MEFAGLTSGTLPNSGEDNGLPVKERDVVKGLRHGMPLYLKVNKRNTGEGLEKSGKQMASRLERTPVVQIAKGIAWGKAEGKKKLKLN